MPLEIRPLVEDDIPELVRIQLRAFNSGIASKLTPSPRPASWIEIAISKHQKSMRTEPDVHYMKVIDTALGGKMFAAAKWRINEQERTEEQIQGMLPKPGKDEEGNQAAHDFMAYLCWARTKYMGTKPFYCE